MTMNERAEPAEPGVLDRLRARYEPFDHFVRAFLHFRNCNGNLCAAGLTYYTLIALFPLVMVAVTTGGSLPAFSSMVRLFDSPLVSVTVSVA